MEEMANVLRDLVIANSTNLVSNQQPPDAVPNPPNNEGMQVDGYEAVGPDLPEPPAGAPAALWGI